MIIKYICECCDKVIEEVIVSEALVNLLDDDDSLTTLTGVYPEDIMKLELQGSLVLQSMCPECLAELNFGEGGSVDLGTPVIN